jgi:hypothetical protein
VLALTLVLVLLYTSATAVAPLVVSLPEGGLPPLIRLFVWFVVTASVGYALLRQHGRYPRQRDLLTALGLAVVTLCALRVALVLRLAPDRATGEAGLVVLAATVLFVVGTAGFAAASVLFGRVSARP